MSSISISINIPSNFIPERKYALSVLFGEFLGFNFETHVQEDVCDYIISLANGNQLVIKDGFFTGIDEVAGYLSEKRLAVYPFELAHPLMDEFNCLSLYGADYYEDNSFNNIRTITIGADIIASSFFMLTRWEELLIQEHDKHKRVMESQMLTRKLGFEKRPIVNEYVDLIYELLKMLGLDQKRLIRKYEFILTHDVDQIARFDSPMKLGKALAGDIVLRKKPQLMVSTASDYFKVKLGIKRDNYDTTDFIMSLAENRNIKSRFYFIPAIKGDFDFRYDIYSDRSTSYIKNVLSRGHIVGIHGSYNSYNDSKIFGDELARLSDLGVSVKEGRQHYLRFTNPATWQMWDDFNLERDSSVGFHSAIGFRSGVCYSYSVFNVLTRKVLKLKEQPLLVMEAPLINNYHTYYERLDEANGIINEVKKHQGEFVFLWHPNNLFHPQWIQHITLFKDILALS